MEKKLELDYAGIKAAVEAVLQSSDTLCVGIRDDIKKTDTNGYFAYEHSIRIREMAEEVNNKLQDFIGEIERMEEERKEAQIGEFVCPICNADYDNVVELGTHMIDIHKTHTAEMKAGY
jgi:uncharacterized protein (UPF0335 family)